MNRLLVTALGFSLLLPGTLIYGKKRIKVQDGEITVAVKKECKICKVVKAAAQATELLLKKEVTERSRCKAVRLKAVLNGFVESLEGKEGFSAMRESTILLVKELADAFQLDQSPDIMEYPMLGLPEAVNLSNIETQEAEVKTQENISDEVESSEQEQIDEIA